MNATLRLLSTIVAYSDSGVTNNPRLQWSDWKRDVVDLAVKNPQAQGFVVPPNTELLIFDGTRALATDGTTQMSVALVAGTADRYRFRVTSGTTPAFRTTRAINLSASTVSVAVNANGTALFTITAGAGNFTSVVVGDTLWLPDATEAAGQPFNAANQGFWTVLAKTSSTITATRIGAFQAAAEAAVAVTTATQFQAFSAAGVQAGDKLQIVSGFASSTQRTYPIEVVTPAYLEVSSSQAVAAESSIVITAAGMVVFTSAKQFLHVEADQECVVHVNGDTSDFQRVTPFIPGDQTKSGSYERCGVTFQLKILNKTSLPLNAVVISAE